MIRNRQSIRLRGYDYSQPGAYFITLCVGNNLCLLGEIKNGVMRLNEAGEIIRDEWLRTADIRPEIALDEFVIMPNHFHAILWIRDTGRSYLEYSSIGYPPFNKAQRPQDATTEVIKHGPANRSLGAIMAGFKSATTRHINALDEIPDPFCWHRNFYDRIVRDTVALNRVRQYIRNNPLRWEFDGKNPDPLFGYPSL